MNTPPPIRADDFDLNKFLRESLRIENIIREPSQEEIYVTEKFLDLKELSVNALTGYVQVFAPYHVLRAERGSNVMVGGHSPPQGGPQVKIALEGILDAINKNEVSAFEAHCAYEWLHPFTDGNGRSGRALWLWLMNLNGEHVFDSSFLHTFYYQSLAYNGRTPWWLEPGPCPKSE